MFNKNKIVFPIVLGIAALIFTIVILVSEKPVELNKKNHLNIILVMTDDLSNAMLDMLLENNMMPNLQKHVIDTGTTFSNSFVSSPLCCPSRATTLTGQYPHNHGVLWNNQIRNGNVLIYDGGFYGFNDTSTIATMLKKHDYQTGFIGKYLNQYDPFQEYVNSDRLLINRIKDSLGDYGYIPPGWSDWYAFGGGTLNVLYNYTINENGIKVQNHEDYKTDYISNRTVDFINNSDSPFFLYVSTVVPHFESQVSPCELSKGGIIAKANLVSPEFKNTLNAIDISYPPSFNEEDVSDKPPLIRKLPLIENIECLEKTYKQITETVRSVDNLIGDIYNALEENNIQNNTVIIFTSDNGFLFGEHRFYGKSYPYEETIRVPLFISIPGLERQTVNQLVLNNDIAPTIAELAGAKPDIYFDGFSLLPILNDTSNELREGFLIELESNEIFYHAVRDANSIYVEYDGGYSENFGFREFYDLDEDPFQQSNLISCADEECLKKIEQFSEWLDDLKGCGAGTCQILENK